MEEKISKLDAKPVCLIGHPEIDTGERMHLLKIKDLFDQGRNHTEIKDLDAFFSCDFTDVGYTNIELIKEGYSPVVFKKDDPLFTDQEVWVITWCLGAGALASLPLSQAKRVVCKFQVIHPQEKIYPEIYEKADVLITESLLANLEGAGAGIAPEKMIYLPHFSAGSLPPRDESNVPLIGMCSRLEEGKNVECALLALKNLREKGQQFHFELIGRFPKEKKPYHKALKKLLREFQKEPWFEWIEQPLSHEQALARYARYSLALHVSGAEAGSHTVVEYLALGIPTIVPNCSTYPYMFKGGALFVPVDPTPLGTHLTFFRPLQEELEKRIAALLNSKSLRAELSEKAFECAYNRFSKQRALKRMNQILEGVSEKQALTLLEEDRRLYGV